MTPTEFVDAIRNVVLASAVKGTVSVLERPPGRRPREELVRASAWFHSLSESDKAMLRTALEIAAHGAVFGLFSVLDGVRAVEDGEEKGSFRLTHVRGDKETVINSPDGISLHDLLNMERV
jgi:hypothetical protein